MSEEIKTEENTQRELGEKSDDILNYLRKGKEAYTEFGKKFREMYLISGKLIGEWEEHFEIDIPADTTPPILWSLDRQIAKLHQEASFLKAESSCRLEYIKAVYNKRYRAAFNAIIAEYKTAHPGSKLPSKDTMATQAESRVGDIKDAITHAEIELSFWKEMLADLAHKRRIVNDMTINLGIETKILNGEKAFEHFGRNSDE